MQTQTSIDEKIRKDKERSNRRLHNIAFDAARARGADFHCATMFGFAATNTPPTPVQVCAKCRRLGVDGSLEPLRTTEAA
jgi:hypothetical protein